MNDLFDFGGEQKQREMGVAIPGNSILAMRVKVDDKANEKGLVRNKDDDKDMLSIVLECISEPFKGATIFDYAVIKCDNPKAKNAKTATNIGRAAVRGMIDSIQKLSEDDDSQEAMKKRRVPHLKVLDGKILVVKTKLEPNQEGKEYAHVAKYVTKGEAGYADAMEHGISFVGDVMPDESKAKASKPKDDWGDDDVDAIPDGGENGDEWAGESADKEPAEKGGVVPDWA